MRPNHRVVALASLLLGTVSAFAAAPPSSANGSALASHSAGSGPSENLITRLMKPMSSITHGTVTVEGKTIKYEAVAGRLVIDGTGAKEATPEVAMGYEAYFEQGTHPSSRPITFIYNGGPGAASLWLQLGAWGPKRVVTRDHTHTPAAPYQLINNQYSLLDASDLVFIDMPGTGFGRLLPQGKTAAAKAKDRRDLEKQFWGVDGDAQAFARFITQFLSKYNRWNSPKYLYGESYGTTRSAVLAGVLELQDNIDLNGVVMQSQVLNFNLLPDGTHADPGVDMAYVLALPSYAAVAWYHKKLPVYDNIKLGALLKQVIQFTKTDYEQALFAGSTLSAGEEKLIAAKLHDFTGLPTAYWMKADLRVSGGMFEHELLDNDDASIGRLDARFSGPSMDPMSKEVFYDPMQAAISSAYISAFNEYVRETLKFGQGMNFRPGVVSSNFHWNKRHRARGSHARSGSLNVMGASQPR